MMYSNLENLMRYLEKYPENNYRKVSSIAEYYIIEGEDKWRVVNSIECKVEIHFRDMLFSKGYV